MDRHDRAALDETRLLTISDVQDRLQISRATVYALIRRGDLVPIRIGQLPRFSATDLVTYLAQARERSGS